MYDVAQKQLVRTPSVLTKTSNWSNIDTIPSYITNLPKKAFKRILRQLLFDILEMEDDYIEISLVIKKLGRVRYIC